MLIMQAKYDATFKSGTWYLWGLPTKKRAIGAKWNYTLKQKPHSSNDFTRARLVGKGLCSQKGIDFYETLLPLVV